MVGEIKNIGDGQLRVIKLIAAGSFVFVAGCATAPGMYVGGATEGASKWLFYSGKPTTRSEGEVPPLDVKVIPISAATLPTRAQAAETNRLPPSNPNLSSELGYRLGSQDILRVDVWGHADLSSAQQGSGSSAAMPSSGRVVDENGQIFVPLVGLQQAAGLTVAELRASLASSLSKFIKNPQVEVGVVSYRSKRVLIAGEVRSPGVLALTDVPLRITDAIGSVGGPALDADLSQSILARGGVNYTLDINLIYSGGNNKLNLLLEHGDVLTIPDRLNRKVFVLGELTAPRSHQLRNGRVSLAEILSDSGGPNPMSSNAGEVFVIRPKVADIGAVVYKLDAADPTALVLADRFEMRPRDIVYVNPTNLTRIGRVMAQLLPTLTGASGVRSIVGN